MVGLQIIPDLHWRRHCWAIDLGNVVDSLSRST